MFDAMKYVFDEDIILSEEYTNKIKCNNKETTLSRRRFNSLYRRFNSLNKQPYKNRKQMLYRKKILDKNIKKKHDDKIRQKDIKYDRMYKYNMLDSTKLSYYADLEENGIYNYIVKQDYYYDGPYNNLDDDDWSYDYFFSDINYNYSYSGFLDRSLDLY